MFGFGQKTLQDHPRSCQLPPFKVLPLRLIPLWSTLRDRVSRKIAGQTVKGCTRFRTCQDLPVLLLAADQPPDARSSCELAM